MHPPPHRPVPTPNPIRSEKLTSAETIQVLFDQIQSLDKAMTAVRMEKIARIKKALAEGTYHVSAADVARKIIDAMQEP